MSTRKQKGKMKHFPKICMAMLLLAGCGEATSVSNEMQYIKTSVLYDTIVDMYENPSQYLGGMYHMTGVLYPSKESNGEKFYSIYAEEDSEGIGIELKYDDFSDFSDYETVTVEGKLKKETFHDESGEMEILILEVTKLDHHK